MLKFLFKANSSSGADVTDPSYKLDLERAERIVDILKNKYGVKLLAFDFDETLLDVPAMPYQEDAAVLASKHFRGCFKSIMTKALAVDLACCVVSFNCDRQIIEKTVEQALPNKKDAKKVLVVTSQWSIDDVRNAMYRYGKQQHLDLAKKEFHRSCGHDLQPLEIFLFDDNKINIKKALTSGHHCYLVDKTVNTEQILDFVVKQSQKLTAVAPVTANTPTPIAAPVPVNLDPTISSAIKPQNAESYIGTHAPMYAPMYAPISVPLNAGFYPTIDGNRYPPANTMQPVYADIGSILSFNVASH